MPKHGSRRATVLEIVDSRQRFLTAAHISFIADISYKQAVDTLQALHNRELIHRDGHKFTARWGSLKLAPPQDTGVNLLEATFRGFFMDGPRGL